MAKTVSFIFAVLLAVSAVASAEVTNLECTQTGDTEYRLTYSFTGNTHKVVILASADPTGAVGLKQVAETADATAVVYAGKFGERQYFFLIPDHGAPREVSIRHIALEGTPNFRDLGGYETTDGRFVRWGILYRSGVLSNLTAKDFTYLSQLGVREVCDFRTDLENATAPEVWVPGAGVEHIHLPIGPDSNKDWAQTMEEALGKNPTPEQLKSYLTHTYGDFAFTHASEYRKLFAELKEGPLPLLYHCTAGKDRTGVFSAFVLLTLGVPEKTALADYELTNKYLRDAMSPLASHKLLASSTPRNSPLANLTPDQQHVLMAADPDYLKATLRQIEAKYGSFANYRRTELGVSDTDVEILRARLLER
jgi:protein-tyrosine phosphatase